MTRHTNILFDIREAARTDVDQTVRYALRTAADGLEKALNLLATDPTRANMQDVNGMWAYACQLLKLHKTMPEPTPPTQAVQDQRKAA